ncbi:MAG: hypothetical protein SH868_13710 [Bythopirellula sp.]|nr:hypothetical protein [Bythopirellula sp.]
MSSRNLLSLVCALACLGQIGCAGCLNCARMGGGCGMCASCGVPAASCGCPDCGCADACCDVECGCPEPECGCVDPCCGAPGCGTMVGCAQPLANCPLLVSIRNFFCGCGTCGGGCSCETYTGDWNCNPPCAEPCDQCGNYTGAQYGMPMSSRPQIAERVKSDEIRFATGNKASRR